MDLNERLSEDQKSAMKTGDQARVGVLRLLRTRVKEAAVQKRDDLSDGEIYKVIMTELKRRQEAIDLFEKGGRGDLAARDKEEMGILEAYLPPKLTADELKAHALEAIKEVDAISQHLNLFRHEFYFLPSVLQSHVVNCFSCFLRGLRYIVQFFTQSMTLDSCILQLLYIVHITLRRIQDCCSSA